ncbi:unnamed protein product [Durusdinium trenchii]|uniref:Uncharacterized protein n=2 Tax=Durusdinium trenchii TaxID=1381693 RepID=A0ABP0Q6X1_9DINO
MSARPRSSSAKQTLRSSRGFNDRSNRAPPRRVGRAETRDLAEPRSEAPAPAAAQAEVQHAQTEPPCHREICSICLEGLDDHSFSYPCGQGHRLHYGCMLHFLANVLSLPLADGSPGPLLKEKARDLGSGFKAIAVLEGALHQMTPETQGRLACPLCRCPWPDEHQLSLAEVVSQLRNCRLRTVVKHFGKLTHALQEVQQRFDERAEVAVYRMGSGWRRMESHLHTCSSFLSASVTGCPEVEMILAFLDARHVTSLSASFASAYRHCWADAKLRAPNLKVASVRSATHRILPSAAKTLLVDPNLGSPVSRGISGLDVIAFSKWLQKARSMKEITMTGADWERLDPGIKYLTSNLPMQQLRLLDLSHNGLTDVSAENLAKALSSRSVKLEVLTLELNFISEQGFKALLRLGAGRVHSWGFRHNQLGDESCKVLAKTFDPEITTLNKRRLETWDLRTNQISGEGCKWLASMIGHMVVARLGCNPLGDHGGEQLANGLGPQLRVLDLRQAQLGEAASLALGRRLREARHLEELLLSGNEIGPAGVQALAEGWAWISSLRLVDLSGNPRIGSEGVDLLVDELPFWQQAPFRLALASIDCPEKSAKKLANALRKNPRHNREWTIELQNNPLPMASILEIHRLLEPREAASWSPTGFGH